LVKLRRTENGANFLGSPCRYVSLCVYRVAYEPRSRCSAYRSPVLRTLCGRTERAAGPKIAPMTDCWSLSLLLLSRQLRHRSTTTTAAQMCTVNASPDFLPSPCSADCRPASVIYVNTEYNSQIQQIRDNFHFSFNRTIFPELL